MNEFIDPGIQLLLMHSRSLDRWGPFTLSAPHWRLYHNDRSGAWIKDGKREIPLEPDKCYLIPPETDLVANLRSKVNHFFIHFTANPPYERAKPGVYGIRADKGTLKLISEAEKGLRDEGQGHVALCSLRGLALVHWALSHLPPAALLTRPLDERIEKTVAAIRNRTGQSFSNIQLAEMAHMTTNAFIRRFHEIMGESPQQYARRRRIDKACLKLHFSSISIQAIAEETGFCDRYHFSRVFKRVRGMSPAKFRKAVSRKG